MKFEVSRYSNCEVRGGGALRPPPGVLHIAKSPALLGLRRSRILDTEMMKMNTNDTR